MRRHLVGALLALAVALGGCGLKGPLSLPEKSGDVIVRPGQTSTTPATPAESTPAEPAAPEQTTPPEPPAQDPPHGPERG
jgi:predicted small lipoprotein YifL